MTDQEIIEFVQGELSYLNLTTDQIEKYIKYVNKLNNYANRYHWSETADEIFLKNLEEYIEFFKMQGFDDKTALDYTKIVIIETDKKFLKSRLAFLRMLNIEESVLGGKSYTSRFNLKESHARKMYLVENNLRQEQTRDAIIKQDYFRFQERFNINISNLLLKYPITEQTIEIWMFVTSMKDTEFEKYFGMTRQELSYIYPTTKDEVATIHKIALMSDNEIKATYGIERLELLNKYPLNSDTLIALKTIHSNSKDKIERIFEKPIEEILHLRTITTDMIKNADREYKLKRGTYSKEELRAKLKTITKAKAM